MPPPGGAAWATGALRARGRPHLGRPERPWLREPVRARRGARARALWGPPFCTPSTPRPRPGLRAARPRLMEPLVPQSSPTCAVPLWLYASAPLFIISIAEACWRAPPAEAAPPAALTPSVACATGQPPASAAELKCPGGENFSTLPQAAPALRAPRRSRPGKALVRQQRVWESIPSPLHLKGPLRLAAMCDPTRPLALEPPPPVGAGTAPRADGKRERPHVPAQGPLPRACAAAA
jgi:hypothetical protein